jgi:hypothetical protein
MTCMIRPRRTRRTFSRYCIEITFYVENTIYVFHIINVFCLFTTQRGEHSHGTV